MSNYKNLAPEVGDFLTEPLYTDTSVREVVKTTAHTIRVRKTKDGAILQRRKADGNPWPIEYIEALADENGTERTVRLRKDGTYRIGGGHPLREVTEWNDKPVRVVDYRY